MLSEWYRVVERLDNRVAVTMYTSATPSRVEGARDSQEPYQVLPNYRQTELAWSRVHILAGYVETHVFHAEELVTSVFPHSTGSNEHLLQGRGLRLGLLLLLLLLGIFGSRT